MSAPAIRFRGMLGQLPRADRDALLARAVASDNRVAEATRAILAEVRRDGDAALIRFAERFDHVELTSLEVPRAQWTQALAELPAPLRKGLERAKKNIAAAHRAFRPSAVEVETELGVVVGRRPDPLARVGVYAPGGRAAYPSSVLMGAVPAKIAGVEEVILCSPPQRDGKVMPVVLAAAALAEVDRVFAVGGAGAIAAMAYGTQSIPRVERIVGPGNAYVAEAKQQLAGEVGIDSPAGPSELLAIVDGKADAAAVARELLAQAEHDPSACVVALCIGDGMSAKVERALAAELEKQPRREVVEQSLASRGAILGVTSLHEAVTFANAFAAEHLLLALEHAPAALPLVRNAGTVFVGEQSSVAFGDYLTGSNHVLPTGGKASIFSGLSTSDFMRWTSYQRVTREAAAAMADDVKVLAESEGLFAHAAAGSAWGNQA